MLCKVKVIFKDGAERVETFNSQEHLEAFVNYINRALEGCIKNVELVPMEYQVDSKPDSDKI